MRARQAKKIATLWRRKRKLEWKRSTLKRALDAYLCDRFRPDRWSERAW